MTLFPKTNCSCLSISDCNQIVAQCVVQEFSLLQIVVHVEAYLIFDVIIGPDQMK